MLLLTLLVAIVTNIGVDAYVENLLSPPSLALINLTNYDSAARPPGFIYPNSPVNVTINIFLRQVQTLDPKTSTLKLQITLREEWIDPRLAFSNESFIHEVTLNDVDKFWKPDVFFSNEREAHWHDITKPNVFARISSDGGVMLSTRISLTLECRDQPNSMLGHVVCKLRMASYGYTTDDVVLQWKTFLPIQLAKSMSVDGYELEHTSTEDCTSYTSTGAYGCLEASLVFSRDNGAILLHIGIPTFFLITACWSTFWMPVAPITPRLITVSVATATTIFFNSYQKTVWNIPHFSFMDWWMFINSLYVYSAFCHCIYVIYWTSQKTTKNRLDEANNSKVLTMDRVARKAFLGSYILLFFVPCVWLLFFISIFN